MDSRIPLHRSRRVQLASLTLGHLLVDMYGGFLFPMIPVLVRHMGVRLSVVTTLIGIGGLLVNGIQPVAGIISPKFQRPHFLLLGPLLAVCITLVGLTSDYWLVLILVLVGNIGIGIFHPDGLMNAHMLSGSKAHLGVPIFMSGGFLGFSLGSLVSAQWLGRCGFDGFWLLALPGLAVLVLLAVVGFQDKHRQPNAVSEVKAEVNFLLLMVLGIAIATQVSVFFMFASVDLTGRFGEQGLRWGGLTLAVIGLASTGGSFIWGFFSARFSAFGLLALGQLVCMPLYWLLCRADSLAGLLVLAVPTGLCFGSAFFPLIATAARSAKGMTPTLRAGLIVGGSWGIGSLIAMGCGCLTDYGITSHQILLAMLSVIGLNSALAGWVYLRKRPAVSPGNQKNNGCND